ncbi:MAG: phosphocholine cytidylyltransferase family protein [Parcubacteria group bacterium]|nr:phosphocholine cytidylyltransferase family protein [Parcubacteria group bacterium]
MKAIILAAGMGTRLGKYTENLPKCMLKFLGKTLIERQIKTLKSSGIENIVVVTGYQGDKINLPGIKYYKNEKYAQTNMVESLFSAEKELTDEILIAYSDIIYEKRIIDKILNTQTEIGVAVDNDYQEYWQARLNDPTIDTESMIVNENGNIVELGNPCKPDEAKTRYVGLIKFSGQGIKILKEVYHKNKDLYYNSDKPWLGSKSFRLGYMTSLLQAIINDGHKVKPIVINRGWLEFDTVNDYDRACAWSKNGQLKKFINLSQ